MGVKPSTRTLALQAERANQLLHAEFGMRLAHQNHAHARVEFDQPAQRAQRLGDSLVRLQISEGANERRGFVNAQ